MSLYRLPNCLTLFEPIFEVKISFIPTFENSMKKYLYPRIEAIYQDFSVNIDPSGHKKHGGTSGPLG